MNITKNCEDCGVELVEDDEIEVGACTRCIARDQHDNRDEDR